MKTVHIGTSVCLPDTVAVGVDLQMPASSDVLIGTLVP